MHTGENRCMWLRSSPVTQTNVSEYKWTQMNENKYIPVKMDAYWWKRARAIKIEPCASKNRYEWVKTSKNEHVPVANSAFSESAKLVEIPAEGLYCVELSPTPHISNWNLSCQPISLQNCSCMQIYQVKKCRQHNEPMLWASAFRSWWKTWKWRHMRMGKKGCQAMM